MAKILGPRKVRNYSKEFKSTAVRLSNVPGVQVQDVAEALLIHPTLLTRWRKESREGLIEHNGESKLNAEMASAKISIAGPRRHPSFVKWEYLA